MKRTPKFLLSGLLSCLPLACTTANQAPDREVIAAHNTVDTYYFEFWGKKPEERAQLFTFRRGKNGYTLVENATGRSIRRNIYYVKTFGGSFPAVKIQLINSRFIAFPETIKGSEVQGSTTNEMKAVTRIYDLKRHKLLTPGSPYQYDTSVPLIYELWQLPTD